MSFVDIRRYALACDGNRCGRWLTESGRGEWSDEWKAEEAAKRAGWDTDGGLHYCQSCAKKKDAET